MRTDPQSLLLVIGGAGFVLVLVLKWLIAPQRRDAAYQQARRRMLSAKRRASDRTLPALERAASFREAARIALEEPRALEARTKIRIHGLQRARDGQ